ncbi:hypothetical protein [Niabella aurantiaca]|uniref:hypothetical protein n=1 Tax=Niabella aurantiaca TaxID=379900 RepID=UPI000374126C|nr:hypothetical protein [Niabella aurantiaca]
MIQTIITTATFLAILYIGVRWADRKRKRDQLNEQTKWPESGWKDEDFYGW